MMFVHNYDGKSKKINLFLILGLATMLLASPLSFGDAFADDDKEKTKANDRNNQNNSTNDNDNDDDKEKKVHKDKKKKKFCHTHVHKYHIVRHCHAYNWHHPHL